MQHQELEAETEAEPREECCLLIFFLELASLDFIHNTR